MFNLFFFMYLSKKLDPGDLFKKHSRWKEDKINELMATYCLNNEEDCSTETNAFVKSKL